MSSKTLIEKQTGAVTIIKWVNVTQEMLPATFQAFGLAGVEVVPILWSPDNKLTSEAAQQEGSAVELTATNNNMAVNSPGLFGVTKPTTGAAVGVFFASGVVGN